MIPADKRGHLRAGALAAAFGAVVGLLVAMVLLLALRLAAPEAGALLLAAAGQGALVCGVTAGLTKELADLADNRLQPGMHGVELLDAVATAAPGVLVCVVFCWLAYLAQAGAA